MSLSKELIALELQTPPPFIKGIRFNHMKFGQALEALKQGKAISRNNENWRGKCLYFHFNSDKGVPGIDISHGNTMESWMASNVDLLAEDWIIVS